MIITTESGLHKSDRRRKQIQNVFQEAQQWWEAGKQKFRQDSYISFFLNLENLTLKERMDNAKRGFKNSHPPKIKKVNWRSVIDVEQVKG